MTVILGQGRVGREAVSCLGDTWSQAKAHLFALRKYNVNAQAVADFHNDDTSKTFVLQAPARSSKSFAAAADIMAYCLPTRPLLSSRHAVIGADYRTNREFEYLFEWFVEDRDRVYGKTAYQIERAVMNKNAGDMEIRLNFGRDHEGREVRCVILGLSAQNEKSLQGEQWTTWTQSEAAEHDPIIYQKYGAQRAWRYYFPTTPRQTAQWLRELCEQAAQNPDLAIGNYHFPRWANPHYDEENFEIQRMMAAQRARATTGREDATAEDDPFFAEQFLGRWVYYSGKVLPFRPDLHVIPDRVADAWAKHPDSDIWVSNDYGYDDPASAGLWAVAKNGTYIRFDEVYARKLTTRVYVEEIQKRLDHRNLTAYKATGDPSRPEVAREIQEAGMNVVEMDKNAQRDRAAGKRRLCDLMVEGPMPKASGTGFYPGLLVAERCIHTIREWDLLHYADSYRDEDSATALKGADHAYDDARYFCMSRPLPLRAPTPGDWLQAYQRRHDANRRLMRFNDRMAA